MNEKYRIEQPIAYKILSNSIKNNKFFHAYLFEKNDYVNYFYFIIDFVKKVICPHNLNKNCEICNICNNIDNNEYIELKIITPDGMWIKKNQIDELQEEFSKKNIIGRYKVYIIDDAEKLNISSANSLLKFLEEPNDNIIGILIVNKADELLKTIVSRCQVITLRNYIKYDDLSFNEKINIILKNDKKMSYLDQFELKNNQNVQKIVNFVQFLEKNGEKTICYINDLIPEIYEKNNLNTIISIILNLYKDVIYIKNGKKMHIFNDFEQKILEIEQKNTINDIISKIYVILEVQEAIKYNANIGLLIDKFIIEMSRCKNESRSSWC